MLGHNLLSILYLFLIFVLNFNNFNILRSALNIFENYKEKNRYSE